MSNTEYSKIRYSVQKKRNELLTIAVIGLLIISIMYYFTYIASWWANYEPGKFWSTGFGWLIFLGLIGAVTLAFIICTLIKTRK